MPGLLVVATLAKCLPVVFIPKECLIASVRNDVVNHRCLHKSAVSFAHYTQRIVPKVTLAFPLPLARVATRGGRPFCFRMQRLVFITIFLSVCNKLTTAGMLTRYVWSVRHLFHSQKQKSRKTDSFRYYSDTTIIPQLTLQSSEIVCKLSVLLNFF